MESRDIIINEVLLPALSQLYEVDYDNIRWGVSERNICARLAFHMENIMRSCRNREMFNNYYADVEYNRMGNGEQKHYLNSKHLPQKMVSDLLIQSRGEPRNLLAVEMKNRGNNKKRKEDRDRLKALVSSVPVYDELPCVYGTVLGAFIIYSSDFIVVELYESVDGIGTRTDVIHSDIIEGHLIGWNR